MRAQINGYDVVFSRSGNKSWPINLDIDGLFIGHFQDFQDAENEADRITKKYKKQDDIQPGNAPNANK